MDKSGCCWQGKLDILPAESTGMGATVRQTWGSLCQTHTHIHTHVHVQAVCLQCAFTAAGACHPVECVHSFDAHALALFFSNTHWHTYEKTKQNRHVVDAFSC